MRSDDTNDSIPQDIAEFLSFFEKHLGGLSFPDVDRDTLCGLAESVRAEAATLDALEQQVQAQRQALESARCELRRVAERGLAYARVYADGKDGLDAKLDALSISRGGAPASEPARKPRGRGKAKTKQDADTAGQPRELPFAEGKSSEAA
jgi:hypothetical protein